MPDGRTFDDPSLIFPGWRLRVPPEAQVGSPVAPASVHHRAATPAAAPSHPASPHPRPRGGHRGAGGTVPIPAVVGAGVVLIALAAAARRRVRTTGRVLLNGERAIDTEMVLLSLEAFDPVLITSAVRSLAAAGLLDRVRHLVVGRDEVTLIDGSWRYDPFAATIPAVALVLVLGELGGRTHVALVPAGAQFSVAGPDAADLVRDAVRVAPSLGLGTLVTVGPEGLLRALALRDDGELVVCVADPEMLDPSLLARCALITATGASPAVECADGVVVLDDGPCLEPSSLSPEVRELLDGTHDRPAHPGRDPGIQPAHSVGQHGMPNTASVPAPMPVPAGTVIVRLLTAVPRIDGLAVPLEQSRERRAVELLAYLSLREGEPVTGERLRMRVLGNPDADAAAKTLFNVASSLRRSLGDGPDGPRLPAAGRLGRYAVTPDVTCDVVLLTQWLDRARATEDPEERLAWIRSALELIEGEPFATVLAGYDWFLAEGHLTRLQVMCEDAACELVSLALERGLLALATVAVERARLIEPSSEHLSMAASDIAEARLRATEDGQWRTSDVPAASRP
jgi:hypothetical protein